MIQPASSPKCTRSSYGNRGSLSQLAAAAACSSNASTRAATSGSDTRSSYSSLAAPSSSSHIINKHVSAAQQHPAEDQHPQQHRPPAAARSTRSRSRPDMRNLNVQAHNFYGQKIEAIVLSYRFWVGEHWIDTSSLIDITAKHHPASFKLFLEFSSGARMHNSFLFSSDVSYCN